MVKSMTEKTPTKPMPYFECPKTNKTECGVRVVDTRVKKTAGNRTGYRGYRSNRPGPVPVPAGSNRAQIQILNLNSKKWKNPQKILKILKVVTNLMMSNFFKYSFI